MYTPRQQELCKLNIKMRLALNDTGIYHSASQI